MSGQPYGSILILGGYCVCLQGGTQKDMVISYSRYVIIDRRTNFAFFVALSGNTKGHPEAHMMSFSES